MRTIVLHVRVAKHHRFRGYVRAEASMHPNQRPLTVGGGYRESEVHTAFFKLKVRIPDELLEPSSTPEFEIEIDPQGATAVTPVVEVEQE